MRVISVSRSEWILLFTGLRPARFRRLVRVVTARGGEDIADGRPARQWALCLTDRVLLVATCWRTNLRVRRVGPLFGVSHSTVRRVIDTIGPLFALAPGRRRRADQVAIVDGTVVPTRDHTLAAPLKHSPPRRKNHRCSTNLRVALNAATTNWSAVQACCEVVAGIKYGTATPKTAVLPTKSETVSQV